MRWVFGGFFKFQDAVGENCWRGDRAWFLRLLKPAMIAFTLLLCMKNKQKPTKPTRLKKGPSLREEEGAEPNLLVVDAEFGY
jgi:hypothetical protein